MRQTYPLISNGYNGQQVFPTTDVHERWWFVMSMPRPKTIYTVAEYLTLERESLDRHEYIDGEIYAMAGESDEHGEISTNLVIAIGSQLKGTTCRVRTKDTKVRSGPTPRLHGSRSGLYSYPDLVVICGEPDYHDDHTDVLLNPIVIIEVLSESTEAFDRGEKQKRYQTWHPWLTDYILVSQDRPEVEHSIRQADGSWAQHHYSGIDASFTIESIRCTVKLADVYDRVEFPKD